MKYCDSCSFMANLPRTAKKVFAQCEICKESEMCNENYIDPTVVPTILAEVEQCGATILGPLQHPIQPITIHQGKDKKKEEKPIGSKAEAEAQEVQQRAEAWASWRHLEGRIK